MMVRVGNIVIKVLCDGCMAIDHKVEFIGRVIAIKKSSEIWNPSNTDRYTYAKCLILNSHMDAKEEYFYPCVQDSSLQKSPNDPNVYFWYV
jgi:hypothetical protein